MYVCVCASTCVITCVCVCVCVCVVCSYAAEVHKGLYVAEVGYTAAGLQVGRLH